MRSRLEILSIFAATVLVVGVTVPAAAATSSSPPAPAQPVAMSPVNPSGPGALMPPVPAQERKPAPGAGDTVRSDSSFVTKHAVSGGQVTADLTVMPSAHGRQGKSAAVDTALSVLTPVPGFPVGAPDAVRPVEFGDAADRLVRLGLDRGPVTLSSKDLTVGAPQQVGGRVHHASAAKDTDLDYRVRSNGVKEALVLRSASAPTSYTFHLADPAGQLGSAQPQPGGGVTFTGRQGDLALSIPPAVAYEQAGADPFAAPAPSQAMEPAAAPAPGPDTSAPTGGGPAPAVPLLPGSDSAMLHVVAAGDGFDVRVAVRPDWLRGKRFPVVLDPSLVFGNADGTVFDATTVVNGNYSLVAHTDDRVGPQVEYNYMWRSYLRFNTSAIPAGATVTSARFHWVRQWGGSYSPRPLELHAINGDWNMNSSSYTMNSLTDTTAAATGTPDTQDFDVTALARDWVSGTRGNYGISAQLNPEVMNDAYAYGFYGYYASRSTSAPSPDVTPHLFVTYNQTTPLPVDVTSLTPHNAAMTATWSTSKDNGPNGPDGYYVDVFDSGGNYVGYANGQPVTGNSVTFGSAYNPYTNSWTNFPNGYALSVRVNPHNAAGFGGYGAARSATVQGAPSAVYGTDGNPATPPSIVVGDGTVSATWTTGNLNGGTLQGYVAFLYPVGQHWPQAATATCYPVLSGTVTFGPAPSGDCSGTAPVNGTAYTVEVFTQNDSGDNYSGPLTDNTGTGPGYGPPATSVASDPCGMIPLDAAHLDAMATCTSGVPLTSDEASSQVTPPTSSASDLDQWAVANAADSYGGLEASGSSYVVHIVRSASSAAALAARVANTAGLTTADAAWSLARLQSTSEQMARAPGQLSFVDVYPDIASNQVTIVARTATPAAVEQFRASWPGVPMLISFDDVTTYLRDDRVADKNPWRSGDRISLTYQSYGTTVIVTCSSGLPIYGPGAYGPGSRYGTTAGHCGGTDSTICQGNTCGSAFGTPSKSVYSQYSDGDEASFSNNAFPVAYTDTPSGAVRSRLIVGSRNPLGGDGICTDGSITGQSCGGHLRDGATHCIQFDNGITNCGLQVVKANHRLSQGGDSGGPVYTYATVGGTTGLLGLGIIVGEGSNSGGRVTIISPVSTMRKALGFTDVISKFNYSQTCC